jgi:hypothetical protein
MKLLRYLKGVIPPAKFKEATRHYFASPFLALTASSDPSAEREFCTWDYH